MVWSQSGSSVHGILQARIMEWVGIPFSRLGCSQPRDQTQVSFLHCRWILYQLSWRHANNQPAAVFSNAAAHFKSPRRNFHPSLLTQSHLQHNIIVRVTSHHLFHITQRSQGTDFTPSLPYPMVRSKSQVLPSLKKRESHKSMDTGRQEIIGAHLRVCLSYGTICICLVFKGFVMIIKFGKLEHLTG